MITKDLIFDRCEKIATAIVKKFGSFNGVEFEEFPC